MHADVAPDGSPVAVYVRLPPLGEPELLHAALPAGCAILELGCGAGRLTHALLALGHPVTAVDQSAAMLAQVQGAETVLGDIETLDLGRTFPAVLLASQLINHVDAGQRATLLASCRRHLAPQGTLLLQRLVPDVALWEQPSRGEVAGCQIVRRPLRRAGKRVWEETEYRLDDQVWRQAWEAYLLEDADLHGELAAAGLMLRRTFGPHETWVEAGQAE
jgi:SAM-dependent methyltransferase